MEYTTEHGICGDCYKAGGRREREYHMLSSGDDKIIWYECGHVLILKDGFVVVQYDFSSL